MLIRRNSSGKTDITRRLAISGIAGTLFGSRAVSQASGAVGDVRAMVVNPKPKATILMADQYGNPGKPIGHLLACPQSCASSRPGYTDVSSDRTRKSIYLQSNEWMREIIFTDDDKYDPSDDTDFTRYQKLLKGYPKRITNDDNAGGCGYISWKVLVTKANLESGTGSLTEKPTGLYNSVAIGKLEGQGYTADCILICAGEWALRDGTPIQKAISEIGNPQVRPRANKCKS